MILLLLINYNTIDEYLKCLIDYYKITLLPKLKDKYKCEFEFNEDTKKK